MLNQSIAVARYRFTFRITQCMRLPQHAGSTLRGAFGHALRDLACVMRARECTDCDLLAQCPFTQIFTPHNIARQNTHKGTHAGAAFSTMQQIPVPYIIEAPAYGTKTYQLDDELAFNMVLFGAALHQLPLIILAWRRALLRGLTRQDGKGELLRVEFIGQNNEKLCIYNEESPVVMPHTPKLAMPVADTAHNVHLHFQTPLRIEKAKKPLGAREISAPIFLRHLIRRVSLLLEFQIKAEQISLIGRNVIARLNLLADNVQGEHRLTWQDWARYSSRQRQKINLGGVTGRLFLTQLPAELFTYVYLGQWLHAGKETVFGLGQYCITQDIWDPNRSLKNEAV